MSEIPEIKKLLDADEENSSKTLVFFNNFTPLISEVIEDAAQLFKTISRTYGQQMKDDFDQEIINKVGRQLNASDSRELMSIFESKNIRDPEIKKLIKQGKDAFNRMWSRRVRGILLILAQRSYMFSITDILRLRVTPAFGYFRLQAETIGIMCLIRDNSTIANEWSSIVKNEDGKHFFKKYHNQIYSIIESYHLDDVYNIASGSSHHARFASVARGFSMDSTIEGDRYIDNLSVKFQEVDGKNPYELLRDTIFLLTKQYHIFIGITVALPEVDDPLLLQTRLPIFLSKVQTLWKKLAEKYPEKKSLWKDLILEK